MKRDSHGRMAVLSSNSEMNMGWVRLGWVDVLANVAGWVW